MEMITTRFAQPANADEPIIRLQEVSKIYKSGSQPFTALNGIDLTVGKGEFLAVVGKSGSGKSTLMNLITGIDRPTAGSVVVAGTAVHKLNEERTAIWRGRTIGVVFQFFQLLPTLTAIENIMLPMDFCHLYSFRQRRERAMALLEQMEMAEHAHKVPATLSVGQQQRVAIARAMDNDPPILAADEPTGNLDSKSAEAVFRLFEEVVGQGKTIVMVTHDQELARRVSRMVLLADGRLVCDSVQARGQKQYA
jgi:putative ABC transport system ATP-binding protein